MFDGLDSLPGEGRQGRPGIPEMPVADLPGPSRPIRVEPIEEPGRQPVEAPEDPGEPEVSPEREREPAEVPG